MPSQQLSTSALTLSNSYYVGVNLMLLCRSSVRMSQPFPASHPSLYIFSINTLHHEHILDIWVQINLHWCQKYAFLWEEPRFIIPNKLYFNEICMCIQQILKDRFIQPVFHISNKFDVSYFLFCNTAVFHLGQASDYREGPALCPIMATFIWSPGEPRLERESRLKTQAIKKYWLGGQHTMYTALQTQTKFNSKNTMYMLSKDW